LLKKASQSASAANEKQEDGKEGVKIYGNYANVDIPAKEVYGGNTKRLEELKHKYDPGNMFSRGMRLAPRPVVVVNGSS
jgi:anti-sigma28 factor (negative regulator of flagellin synthesis)